MKLESKPKLLITFHRDISDVHRGQGVYLAKLISSLKQYFDVSVLDINGFNNSQNIRNNIRKDQILHRNLIKSIFNFIKWIVLEKNKEDYIIISEDLYISLFVIPLCKIFKIPSLYRASDFGIEYRESLVRQMGRSIRILPKLLSLIENTICKISTQIIVPSDDVLENIKKSGIKEEKINIFPYQPYIKEIPETDIERFKKEHDLVGKTCIVFIGNMEYLPNVEAVSFIIGLAREHHDRYPTDNSVYIIAGKYSEKFNNFSSEYLKIIGEVGDIGILLGAMDIGLNPSLVPGGTSIKDIDYLVNGLFVLSTREGAYGVRKNDRLIICKRKEFLENIILIEKTLLGESNERKKIPQEVCDYYISGKWIAKMAKNIDNLN